jgi:oligopeptide/dipeptide ABC transporter ATP-binding protein
MRATESVLSQVTPRASGSAAPLGAPILELKDLKVVFHTYAGLVKALDGVNLKLRKGQTMGLVGESGCGKSVTAAAIVGLLADNAEVVGGQILFNGEDLLKKSTNDKRKIRESRIAMVFQDPMTFLNPVLTIGEQLGEVFNFDKERLAEENRKLELAELKKHLDAATDPATQAQLQNRMKELSSMNKPRPPGRRRKKHVIDALSTEILERMRIADAGRILKEFPHELSGGMRQRCMIAMALARNPDLLIADEITTALDVTIQAQILELLRLLKSEFDSTILIITHDLGVVADVCDRVAVMYAGNVIEEAEINDLFAHPYHPYTQGLLQAVPKLSATGVRLESIKGSVPDLIYPPSGCRFHPRCPKAWDLCSQTKPPLVAASKDHTVECHLYKEGSAAG